MVRYLLIESRDPFEYADIDYMYQVAEQLIDKGNEVTLFLIQNGVFVARRTSKNNPMDILLSRQGKIRIMADEFSLRERGIEMQHLVDGVQISGMDFLVDMLVDSKFKVLWH